MHNFNESYCVDEPQQKYEASYKVHLKRNWFTMEFHIYFLDVSYVNASLLNKLHKEHLEWNKELLFEVQTHHV